MKKILFTFYFIGLGMLVGAQGTNDKKMLENIAKMKSAATVQNFTDLRYSFASMAGNGSSSWLPYYYTALSSLKEGEAHLKNGQTQLAEDGPVTAAKYLGPVMEKEKNNAEFNILLGMIHSFKARLKGAEKDMKLAASYLAAAEKLDPKNPRAALLKAEIKYFTPEDNGGNKAQGIELYKEALKKFDSYKIKTKLDPDWGRDVAEYYASFNQPALTLLTK